MTVHVLGHILEIPSLAVPDWRRSGGREAALAGAGLRIVLLCGTLVAGLVLALATISLAGPWVGG
jgi:type IV secretory pathway TrbD component